MGVKFEVGLDADDLAQAGVNTVSVAKGLGVAIWGLLRSRRTHMLVGSSMTSLAGGMVGIALAGPVGAGLVGLGIVIGSINSAGAVIYGMKDPKVRVVIRSNGEQEYDAELEIPAII